MKLSQKITLGLGVLGTLTLANGAMAQQNSRLNSGATTMSGNMVGRESKAEFDRMNKKGAAEVSAIRPTSAKLSDADQKLMMDVAKGGMMQLETSKIAVQKANSPEVRDLAQAEIEEQTGLSNKLKEIATAKGVTLPSTPDTELQAMLDKMQDMSGMELDQHYVREHGVKGHEKIDSVMNKVKAQASDANLKSVEKAAHPLVKNHLKVAQSVMSKMDSNDSTNR